MTDFRAVPLALSAWTTSVLLVQHVRLWFLVFALFVPFLFTTFRYTAIGCAATSIAICSIFFVIEPIREPPALLSATTTNSVHKLVVRIDSLPRSSAYASNLKCTLLEIDTYSDLSVPCALRGDTAYSVGSAIALNGKLKKAPPGRRESVYISPVSDPKPVRHSPWYLDWANYLRNGVFEKVSSIPGDGGKLLLGLSVGDTRGVGQSLDKAMKDTSLSHLTAVSGSNCAMVVAIIARLFSFLRVRFRVIVSILSLLLFVILVIPDSSIVRAAIMALATLCGLYSGRIGVGLPVLSLAVLGMLLWNPWFACDYGFLLSVAATAGILLMSKSIEIRMQSMRFLRLNLGPIAPLIAVPLSAQLACQPILVLITPQIPLTGVVANAISEPVVPIATILGLLAVLFSPIDMVSHLFLMLGYLPSEWIARVARALAFIPPLPFPGGVLGVMLLITLTLSIIFVVRRLTGTTVPMQKSKV
ncbi:ComEC/Rec2 family competence protein [Tropheryma whipplei]|uniref:ComE operon protein 3-like protein n=1 Tax=Tropheryma whipplei (strain Twist) TaxID=203267 RepID=Q83MW3_TROWT|nr:ComEC/Rec2 family competence protein [Tropheryma whipplei]AAO44480.1 comE operon protein 3-like protein [Tropheryma whipplei str. Twist]MCO8182356.1 ComEC/Rec2 family competence protein [Tropheryma whipplei]MCO8190126.1 ComEC/Rec2 family competence protein [Tropheryma whipplei]CAD67058.1 putative DNA uptake protein [Tropheryma whipplei TW08/27]